MAYPDAIMRWTHDHGSATISVGNLVVDLSHNYAKDSETQLVLPAKESRIIELLALRKSAGSHPLFVEAVIAHLQFISRLNGVSSQPRSYPKIIDLSK